MTMTMTIPSGADACTKACAYIGAIKRGTVLEDGLIRKA
jgi:hypothetical protein